jgi:hypothetical protein
VLRLYLDEDAMSVALARGLEARGVDVTTVADEHMRRRDDAEQLAFAAANGRTIFSFNVGDFMRLHAQYMRENRHHQGIVLVRQQRFGVGEILRRLHRLATTLKSDDMTDRLEFLNDWG